MAMLAMVLVLAEPGSGPGSERLFGNWAVACDNAKRCEATALMPEEWSGGGQAPKLDLGREAGPAGEVRLRLGWAAKYAGFVLVAIDGKKVHAGASGKDGLELRGPAAEAIARAMVKGRTLTVQDRSGRLLATVSLAGASATLRYVDAEQGRAGGTTAIVATGPKRAALVPAAAALPQVPAVRPPTGKGERLGDAAVRALGRRAGCEDGPSRPALAPQFHRLDARATLVAVPCGSGAYQSSWALFVLAEGRAVPAPFDIAPLGEERVPMVIDPEWDAKAGSLATHAKGRGLGDCGFNQAWVWDGARFRMTLLEGLGTCRLSGGWLTRYRAEAVYR
ncbi:DUF1176 domain-containing protein [Sphingomonas sp.]|uniref:DUF1176 domain-containing protein n=1 Tax=Sphingomonas sp. TaxID=28214 RepID=UPI001B18AE35|nr:DUF1176 domain-containing protein [Sphingomonas sp.]MBO9713036.1 DUF1176 domain-containing protein [Sphingomonas sp.]